MVPPGSEAPIASSAVPIGIVGVGDALSKKRALIVPSWFPETIVRVSSVPAFSSMALAALLGGVLGASGIVVSLLSPKITVKVGLITPIWHVGPIKTSVQTQPVSVQTPLLAQVETMLAS